MQVQLRASNLACRRGDRILFRKLSFSLAGGGALHITGANGTGKTTLMRTVAGLMTPFAGSTTHSHDIGLLTERLALDPDLTLDRAIAFWDKIDRFGDPNVETVDMLGLVPLLDVPVRYLSTGQKKRAALAVLIGSNSPIWLLDEPLSGLDADAITLVTERIENHLALDGIALIASHQPLAIEGLKSLELGDYVPRYEAEDVE